MNIEEENLFYLWYLTSPGAAIIRGRSAKHPTKLSAASSQQTFLHNINSTKTPYFFEIFAAIERPSTPEGREIITVPDTEERAHYFWHVEHRAYDESLADVAQQHGIGIRTGQRWRNDKLKFGDEKRTRRRNAQEKNQKLGRPFRVGRGPLVDLLSDETNPHRDAPLSIQAATEHFPLAPRSLRYNLSNRLDAHLYVAPYAEPISKNNMAKRVQYGHLHSGKPIHGFIDGERSAPGFWNGVIFTDEAHFNPNTDFQRPRILRRRGERLDRGNIRSRKLVKRDTRTLHFYSAVNWFFKGDLQFYNDEKDMLEIPKPPRKPVRSKYETDKQYSERVKEWEAKKPPSIEGDAGGHHMTQQYYTEKILPEYIKLLHEQRNFNELSPIRWALQEDGDPSHGTRSSNNVATNLRDISWLPVIVHPPQSPDLNPIEGIWLILKQRAKRRIRWPEEGQQQWDGTKKMLKEILQETWATISIDEIRDRISDMPRRCHELTQNGGEKIRGEKW